MPYGLYISAAAADVHSQRLQILSNNLANADTPGFKRELAIVQAEPAEAIEQGEVAAGTGGIDDIGGGVKLAGTVTDFSPGKFRATAKMTDLAVAGEGFFQIERGGEILLTRAGNFHFSGNGQLQTDQGYPVLAADGQPIAINPALPYEFHDNGALMQAGSRIDLGLVQPQSLGDLAKSGENLFAPLAEVQPVPASKRRVLSGHLELSTVKPTLEMMDLIETSRAYEANIKMIQNQDQMIGALVNRTIGQA